MRRLQLIELHEQSWYPEIFRIMLRKFIGLFLQKTNILKNVSPMFSEFLTRTNADNIIDLCSGSGEAIFLLKELHQKSYPHATKLTYWASDLYPDQISYQILKSRSTGDFFYHSSAVDLLCLPENIPRVRTIINSLHHFTPQQVKEILANAAQNSDGIAIIEVTSRNWKSIFFSLTSIFISPIAGAFFLRPFHLHHIFFSIIVPILPLTVLIDSIVSCLRSYTKDELTDIISIIDCEDFEWNIGEVPSLGLNGLNVHYLFGCRKNINNPAEFL
jgi:SAM-dependent methyltransferase